MYYSKYYPNKISYEVIVHLNDTGYLPFFRLFYVSQHVALDAEHNFLYPLGMTSSKPILSDHAF